MKFYRFRSARLLAAIVVSSAALILAGCAVNPAPSSPSTPVTPATPTPPVTTYSGPAFTGKALAGAQPIVGATIQIYATGTTGATSQATALLTATLTTDSTGSFTVAAGYGCPLSSSLVYAIARGGVVGSAANNSAIVLLTPLGTCSQIASHYVLNEVTTTASAWALSQFLTANANIATTATNSVGISNAFATAANLANPATGVSPGPAFFSADKNPAAAAKINAIANLLNTCTTAAATCNQLFSTAAPTGTSAPANTLDAVLDIVHNPGNNVSSLFTQSTARTAFANALTVAPADWTLYINYAGGGINEPTGIGVDSAGSVWVANYLNVASKFSPLGQPVFPTGITGSGLNASYGLAIDASDNVWIPNEPGNGSPSSITVLNSAGQSIAGNGYTSGGLYYPVAVAIDTNGTVWVVNYGNSHVTLLSPSGTPLSGTTGYTGPAMAFPVSVAIDASHNGWIGDQNDGNITRFSPSGTPTAYACCNSPAGLATDQSGNLWAANYSGDSVSQLNATSGSVTNNSSGGGIYHPQGIAVDGSGNLWVANFHNSQVAKSYSVISQVAGAASASPGRVLSPSTGFAPDANLIEPFAVAIDASGNLWITDFGSSLLTEFVGLAAPVKTPLLGPPQAP